MNNIIYDPNYIPNQPIYIPPQNDQRIIPFLGGAILGGLGGAAIANNNQQYGYYYPYQGAYYYPMNGYYYPQVNYYPYNNGYPMNMNVNKNGSN